MRISPLLFPRAGVNRETVVYRLDKRVGRLPRHVIEKIYALKLKTVSVRAGRAVRKFKVVKSDGPNDLVLQSVKDGKPMPDNNILSRHIKLAARKIGLDS